MTTPKITPQYQATFVEANIIPISPEIAAAVQSAPLDQWKHLFQHFRLNLQSRIIGADSDGKNQLQGSLKTINEVETFFQNLMKKSS